MTTKTEPKAAPAASLRSQRSLAIAAIIDRADAHRALAPDALGRALVEFADHDQLPLNDLLLLNAVLDAELAAFLAVGGDPAGPWPRAIEDARRDPEGAQQRLRHLAGMERYGVLGWLRDARLGNGDLATR